MLLRPLAYPLHRAGHLALLLWFYCDLWPPRCIARGWAFFFVVFAFWPRAAASAMRSSNRRCLFGAFVVRRLRRPCALGPASCARQRIAFRAQL
eukprot:3317420-Alexandrium_andersonii.AAC.1